MRMSGTRRIALAMLWVCAAACAGKQVKADAGAARKDALGEGASREACIDAWLAGRGLGEYGDPPGTMYMGGTPLFDEATGERRDRVDYLLEKHPEIARACP